MFKEKTSFSSTVRVVTPAEYCEQLSIASLADLRKLFHVDVNIEENPDLLFNAFNAAVANRINKNDDGVATDSALAISSRFVHKFTDIEHDRDRVVGHIVSYGFTSFGSNQIIASEALASTNSPFNIALGAVVYRSVAPDFCDELVESSDETSKKHNTISASWELGFNKYHILLGHRDVAEGELITDPKQIKEFAKNLRCYGGSGFTKDKIPVYRLIVGGLPLGIGYTTSPAADVQGVLVQQDEDEEEATPIRLAGDASAETPIGLLSGPVDNPTHQDIDFTDVAMENNVTVDAVKEMAKPHMDAKLSHEEVKQKVREAFKMSQRENSPVAEPKTDESANFASTDQKDENSFSQNNTTPVKDNSNMEIKSTSDIKDDLLKNGELSAASITSYIKSELEKANELYKAQVTERQVQATTLEEQVKDLNEKLSKANSTIESTQTQLQQVQEAQAKALAEQNFNERMASLNERFTLDDKTSAIVAKDINGLSDADYAAWLAKFEVLASSKAKTQTSNASTTTTTTQTTVEAVLETVVADQTQTSIPNASVDSRTGGYDKYKAAFAGDTVKVSRR